MEGCVQRVPIVTMVIASISVEQLLVVSMRPVWMVTAFVKVIIYEMPMETVSIEIPVIKYLVEYMGIVMAGHVSVTMDTFKIVLATVR